MLYHSNPLEICNSNSSELDKIKNTEYLLNGPGVSTIYFVFLSDPFYHNTISIEELANTTPVNPPMVNKNKNPTVHNKEGLNCSWEPCKVANQLKILIPVGTAMIMVADVKQARVSTSILY